MINYNDLEIPQKALDIIHAKQEEFIGSPYSDDGPNTAAKNYELEEAKRTSSEFFKLPEEDDLTYQELSNNEKKKEKIKKDLLNYKLWTDQK